MFHLTKHLSHHKICHKLHPDQCADNCHLALPRYSEDGEEEENFQRKYLKEHCAFMSMDYHMGYAHTHSLMQTIRCLLTWTVWI